MTLILHTFSTKMDRWDDPGDYPSGAGGGPLPSEEFRLVDGKMAIDVTDEISLGPDATLDPPSVTLEWKAGRAILTVEYSGSELAGSR